MAKTKRPWNYDKVLQDLEKQFLLLMTEYLPRIHEAFLEDKGMKASHVDLINTIRKDCMLICSNNLEKLTFDGRTEDQVIKEILEYNFDPEDVKHMKDGENIDLYPIVDQLNEHCLKRTDPAWFRLGIHELIQNGKVDLGSRGSKRTQFCRWCGEGILLSSGHIRTHHSSKKDDSIP
jgi:hypothetical protein